MIQFPAVKPDVAPDAHSWFGNRNKLFLKPLLTDNVKIIIELGSWLGTSTRWFCDNSKAHVYAVDHWLGSIEHQNRDDVKDKLPKLYETFIVNCWDYKNRITPIKMDTKAGMHYLADNDIKPDLIFVDASHEVDDVIADLTTAHTLFPDAILTGDDWQWKNRRLKRRMTVQEAVVYFTKTNNLKVQHNTRCWMITK